MPLWSLRLSKHFSFPVRPCPIHPQGHSCTLGAWTRAEATRQHEIYEQAQSGERVWTPGVVSSLRCSILEHCPCPTYQLTSGLTSIAPNSNLVPDENFCLPKIKKWGIFAFSDSPRIKHFQKLAEILLEDAIQAQRLLVRQPIYDRRVRWREQKHFSEDLGLLNEMQPRNPEKRSFNLLSRSWCVKPDSLRAYTPRKSRIRGRNPHLVPPHLLSQRYQHLLGRVREGRLAGQ